MPARSQPRSVLLALERMLDMARCNGYRPDKMDRILRLRSSALQLFFMRGYENVTVEDIARQAGVTERTFFRCFASKETVVLDVYDSMNRYLLDQIALLETPLDMRSASAMMLKNWAAEFAELGPTLSKISRGSTPLSRAILERCHYWESRIEMAFRQRFPALPIASARFWAMLMFSFIWIIVEQEVVSGDQYQQIAESQLLAYDQFLQGFTDQNTLQPAR